MTFRKGSLKSKDNDIIANLPYDDRCALWFDHHYTNRIDRPFKRAYREAPSAAGIIYAHYPGRFPESRGVLVAAADKIDSADLTMDEVLQPEKYDFVLLAMTISNHEKPDETYWNRLVALLREKTVDAVLADTEVRQNCDRVIAENRVYRERLNRYTQVQEAGGRHRFQVARKSTGRQSVPGIFIISRSPRAHTDKPRPAPTRLDSG